LAMFWAVTAYVLHSADSLVCAVFMEGVYWAGGFECVICWKEIFVSTR
jgi:hypothetical protein